MSTRKLCEACKALLGGMLTRLETSTFAYREYWHHQTARSFVNAQELGCEICLRLLAALTRTAGGEWNKVDEYGTMILIEGFSGDLSGRPATVLFKNVKHESRDTFFATLLFERSTGQRRIILYMGHFADLKQHTSKACPGRLFIETRGTIVLWPI
jgi:hypothetical protein